MIGGGTPVWGRVPCGLRAVCSIFLVDQDALLKENCREDDTTRCSRDIALVHFRPITGGGCSITGGGWSSSLRQLADIEDSPGPAEPLRDFSAAWLQATAGPEREAVALGA